jgi:4-amino-4-deoxy-L-arabinose transferase-like glycosyltransferase
VQGALYLVLVVACLVTAFLFLHATSWMRWVLVGMIGATAFVTYVLTRTVGLPFDRADIGNWGDRLGVAALFVEAVLVLTAAYALRLGRTSSTRRAG